jgi:hypothetical protein
MACNAFIQRECYLVGVLTRRAHAKQHMVHYRTHALLTMLVRLHWNDPSHRQAVTIWQ